MKRFVATVGVFALAASALSSAAWAQGAAAPAKTEPKAETKTETKSTATTPAPAKAEPKAETKAAAPAPATTTASAKTATPAAPAAPAKAAEKKGSHKVDLNSASAEDLKGAGFSDDEARKIIDGRPWKGKDELVKKSVVSAESYKKVKDGIVAHQMKAEAKKK